MWERWWGLRYAVLVVDVVIAVVVGAYFGWDGGGGGGCERARGWW